MDRRSWPWKKKSSEKSAAEKAIATLDFASASLPSGGSQADKDNYKKPSYVQISLESYTHLTGLENQVKSYEKQAKIYEEQAKTYEEQLETMEEEINELNEKLSSATTEITTKEEAVKQHAKVAEDAVAGWEKAEAEALTLKNHLESTTLAKLEVEDRAAHLDNALKECVRQIRNLKEENEKKLQEVALTKNKLYDRMKHDLETKISYLDQDLMRAESETAAVSRSLQERSNMLIKVSEEKSRAEAQIALLKSNIESCEREINSLKYELNIVSKEMEIRTEEKNMSAKTAERANKQQVENVKKITKLEAECQRLRGLVRKKLPGPAALAQMKLEVEVLGRDHGDDRLIKSPIRHSSPKFSSNLDGFQKENEFLTERLFAMEEETKMLKEALAKRNSELQASRSMCATTTNKLLSLEAQLQARNLQKGEDGNDDTVSCSESWGSSMISDFSHNKEKNKDKSKKSDSGNHLELMDDFEEMEKLARNGDSTSDAKPDIEPLSLVKLQSRISRVFNSSTNESDMAKVLENIKHVVQEVQDNVHPNTKNCDSEENCLPENGSLSGNEKKISRELANAISEIHNFILSLGKGSLYNDVEQFTAIFNRVLCNEIGLDGFILALSDVMAKFGELGFDFMGYKVNEVEETSPTCIDKVALPVHTPPQEESYSNGCRRSSDSSSNPEVPPEANILSSFGPGPCKCKCSTEEYELMKAEKDSMERVIFRCSQDLEIAKSKIKDTEEELSEVKLQLGSSQNMNSLAETQLKCMAESYKSLEKRAGELEGEVNGLLEKMESLKDELELERTSHQDALAKCKNLEEQLSRNEECSVCSSTVAEVDDKVKQEKELEAATEKLTACQETIFLLGKQLKSMRPQHELTSSPNNERNTKREGLYENEPTISDVNQQDIDQVEMDTATSPFLQRVGSNSPLDIYNAPFSPSNSDGNISRSPISSRTPTHRPTKSGSSTASSTPTPEKHSPGFSRFFSSKGRNRN